MEVGISLKEAEMIRVERTWESHPVQVLENGTVLVEYGPMRMWINVSENGKPLSNLAREGGYQAMEILRDLARFLSTIKKRAETLEIKKHYPEVVKKMIKATKLMEEPELTPLAAVAGTASEVVADFISKRGGTKIIVDNGGDIAIRLREGEMARIGIKTEVGSKAPSYFISIHSSSGVWRNSNKRTWRKKFYKRNCICGDRSLREGLYSRCRGNSDWELYQR